MIIRARDHPGNHPIRQSKRVGGMIAVIRRWILERKLAAILCADVFGYSRLMGEDEKATLRALTSHGTLLDSQIEQNHGRFVSSAGIASSPSLPA
jgi:class 3 adenylate cyclase